jgi:DNA-binding XRE family transcriptional regulator
MTSIVTPEPKTAAQSPSTADSRAESSDAPQAESTSKPKSKPKPQTKAKSKSKARAGTEDNNVRKLRAAAMMSKAELARRAGVSPLTIDRVEAGCPCRMDTKRKILEALGLSPSARAEVWPGIDEQS